MKHTVALLFRSLPCGLLVPLAALFLNGCNPIAQLDQASPTEADIVNVLPELRVPAAQFYGIWSDMDRGAFLYRYTTSDNTQAKWNLLKDAMKNSGWVLQVEGDSELFARKTSVFSNTKRVTEARLSLIDGIILVGLVDRPVHEGIQALSESKYGPWLTKSFWPRYDACRKELLTQ